ncbi:helix-turn-helix domain-containing protein [Microbispora sp. NPDC049125]|uniref:helix-turn-helix domain-containing protein n=1 Tax=Microbispora sp. NPDC049125 TaxID=3154929 RepID=UPI0034660B54
MSDNELGAFIRAHREAVTPAEVGLPEGPRRRTPGLRRSELATLSGISVEYLTRLEQGRDRQPSPQVLNALADALLLSAEDRMRLRNAAKAVSADSFPCTGAAPPAREVRPTVRALLDRLEPAPAVLLNRLTDVLAFTRGYERLAAPIGLLDAHSPNLVRYAFTDPRARTSYPDWDAVADDLVTWFRSASPPADRHFVALAEELAAVAGAPFSERMRCPLGRNAASGAERLTHPEVGELRLAREVLELPARDSQHLVVYLPADSATSAALDRLTGRRSGALRVVNS